MNHPSRNVVLGYGTAVIWVLLATVARRALDRVLGDLFLFATLFFEVLVVPGEETRQSIENPALRSLREWSVVGLANHSLLIARDGTERPIDDGAAPIRDSDGRLVGVVPLTGWDQEVDLERPRAAGFDHHLVKPAHPDAIVDLLTKARKGER